MMRNEFELLNSRWIDLIEPSKESLTSISEELNIPLRPLLSCLDPEHLPKFENLPGLSFIILRVYDPSKKPNADNIEELTTKVALLIGPTFIISIHRLDAEFIKALRLKLIESPKTLEAKDLLRSLITSSINTYIRPLDELEQRTVSFEEHIYSKRSTDRLVKEGYYLKRRASAYRKIIKFSVDIMNKLISRPDFAQIDFQETKETADRLLFYSDDVVDNVTALLNLHFALSSHRLNEASHRTNEIMRILTVFSIFFLPLNFITGLYGMNFENMPELKYPWGYFGALFLMALVSTLVFGWVWRKGWLTPHRH